MIYAAKLPLSFASNVRITDADAKLGEHFILPGREYAGVSRRGMTRQEAKSFLRLIPSRLRQRCYGISKTAIQCLPPHVHTDEDCLINFYVKTNGEETVFYDGDARKLTGAAADEGNDYYYLVDPASVYPVQSFIAAAGEAWVLNTRQVHAVLDKGAGQEATREVVQVFLDVPPEEVIAEFSHVSEA